MIDLIIYTQNNKIDEVKDTLGSICYQIDAPKVYVHLTEQIDEKVQKHFSQFISIDYCVKNLKQQHIMYMNAGDVFVNPHALKILYKFNKNDIVIGDYNKKNIKLVNSKSDEDKKIFYAKLFNRKKLEKFNLDFSNGIIVNQFINMLNPKTYHINKNIYLAENNNYDQKQYLRAMLEVLKLAEKYNMNEQIGLVSTRVIIEMYHERLRNKTNIIQLKELSKIYNKYKEFYTINYKELNIKFSKYELMPIISFEEFLKEIEND